jgi:DNA-binding transcriptional MerR regulator
MQQSLAIIIEIGAYFNYKKMNFPFTGGYLPKPRPVLNAFTPSQASGIVRMSTHMLNYLARHGYLVPAYFPSGRRGKTRYYSYRDLVIARIVQNLLDAGLELGRLKEGLRKLQRSEHWSKMDLRPLATDGKSLFFPEDGDTLLDLTRHGQLTFAFVLDMSAARREVEQQMTEEQLARFSLKNRRIKFA